MPRDKLDSALIRIANTEESTELPCPTCSEIVSIVVGRNARRERTVDVTHPQPPCDGFRAFVARLWAARG